MAKNIIIGVGNILFYDDGVGVMLVEYLRSNFSFFPELELLDGGTLGFNLIEYFVEYDNVLIIDTISIDAKPGEIYKIPSQELLGKSSYKNTAHEVEVVSMLEACELYEKKVNVLVFGIVPQDINRVEIGLSETLKNRFDVLLGSVLKEIGTLEVDAQRVNDVELNEIIEKLKAWR